MIRKIMSDQATVNNVKLGLQDVLTRIEKAYAGRPSNLKTSKPILVAASKTHPPAILIEAYSAGQRHFGENYVQELEEKSKASEILDKCKDIKWHFIGHLQTNKINKVLSTPGLYMIETIDNEKLATKVNSAWGKVDIQNKEPLKVLVQINISGEQEKSGCAPSEACKLYGFIMDSCPNLKVEGIMTIGKYGHDYTAGPNLDLIGLMKCHEIISNEFKLNPENVQVSMGMSNDFEHAIDLGSSIVRVGTSIFGYRPKKNEQ